MAKTKAQPAEKKPAKKRASTASGRKSVEAPGAKAEKDKPAIQEESQVPVVNPDPVDPEVVASEMFNVNSAIDQLQKLGYLVSMDDIELVTPREAIPTVVIPYKKEAAAGLELLYALRAWDKNLPGCQVVVIGDAEDWFSSELIHIEAPVYSTNPQMDVALKMAIAIEADEVPEEFIWSNDDIYPVTPLLLADIKLLTASGKLGQTKQNVNGTYLDNLKRTLSVLNQAGLPAWDYSTHTPFVFEKSKLTDILMQYRPDQEGFLISSLYYNTYFPDIVPIKIPGGKTCPYVGFVYRENADLEALKQAIQSRKFINHNNKGYKQVISLLKEKFTEKSRFEL